MSDVLPTAAIIAQIEALGASLRAIATEPRNASLANLEQAVSAAIRAAQPQLLGAVLEVNQRALQPPESFWKQPCPRCEQRVGVDSWRSRTVETICGTVTWQRPWYHCGGCGHGFSPVDQKLEVEARSRLSAGLHAWLLEVGTRTSFAEAATLLAKLTGCTVSPETVRQHTERTGAQWEAAAVAESAEVQRTQEAVGPLDPAPGQLVVETDGVMVRYVDGWHEVKLGLVGGLENGELKAVSYVAARTSAAEFGPRLLAEAARRGALEEIGWSGPVTRRGLAILPEVVVLGDGAHWIWDQAAEHLGTRVEIVDFFHAAEHVGAIASALYPDDPAAATAWATTQRHLLRTEGGEAFCATLSQIKAPTEAGTEVLRIERGYFRTNAARMNYPEFVRRGFPIGSGAVEGGVRHVIQMRLKRPGARWSQAGAESVIQLRCRLASGRPLAA